MVTDLKPVRGIFSCGGPARSRPAWWIRLPGGAFHLEVLMQRVRWEMDVDAAGPREAAMKALAIQWNCRSIATVFDVVDADGNTVRVDLGSEDRDVLAVRCPSCGSNRLAQVDRADACALI